MPSARQMSHLLAFISLLSLGLGCQGRISQSSTADGSTSSGPKAPGGLDPKDPVHKDPRVVDTCERDPQDPGAEPMRLLTQDELNYALLELLPSLKIEPQTGAFDTRVGPFVLNGEQKIQKDQVLGFRDMARRVSAQAASQYEAVMGCDGQRELALAGLASGATNEPERYTIPSPQTTDMLVFIGQGNDLNDWNSIWELELFEAGAKVEIIEGHASDSYEVEDRVVERAFDGDPLTRWAGQGSQVLATFKLEREARIDELRISWYDGDKRKAKFELYTLRQDDALKAPDACRDHFIDRVGTRAFRRPLTTIERQGLTGLFDQGVATAGQAQGVQYVLEALLQSSSFIYQHEPSPAPGQARELDSYELAHRMATLIWRGLPDQALLDDAGADRLKDPAVREQHARRMLEHERAIEVMREMITQWFGVDTLSAQSFGGAVDELMLNDDQKQELAESMRAETARMIEDVLRHQDASYKALLTTPRTFMDARLVAHHGLNERAGEPDAQGIYTIESAQRVGLLAQTSFLSVKHDPIHRGQFMRAHLLCAPVPGPGDDVNTGSIMPMAKESMRSVVDRRMQVQPCGGCHQMMDPMGLTLDPFDAAGRWRLEDEHGNTLSSQGAILATSDINGEVADMSQLAQRLASSVDVRACVSKKLFTFGFGRLPSATDSCSLSKVNVALDQHDGDLKEAIIQLVKTDTFAIQSLKGQMP